MKVWMVRHILGLSDGMSHTIKIAFGNFLFSSSSSSSSFSFYYFYFYVTFTASDTVQRWHSPLLLYSDGSNNRRAFFIFFIFFFYLYGLSNLSFTFLIKIKVIKFKLHIYPNSSMHIAPNINMPLNLI